MIRKFLIQITVIYYIQKGHPNNDDKKHKCYKKASDKTNSSRIRDPGNQFYFDDLKDSHITGTINILNGFETREDKLSKALLAQSNYNADTSISQEHLETTKRLEKLEGR